MLAVLSGIGILLLVGALVVDGKGALPDLLVNLGTAVLLFTPLWWLERRLGGSIERLGERVDEADAHVANLAADVERVEEAVVSLQGLTAATQAALERDSERNQLEFDDFASDPRPKTLVPLLQRARQLKAVSGKGARVAIPDTDTFLRFGQGGVIALLGEQASDPVVNFGLESLDGEYLGQIQWLNGTSAVDIGRSVARHLQQARVYPGDAHFDWSAVLQRMVELLRYSIGVRTRTVQSPADLSPVIQLVNEQWAITDYGLEAREGHYFISWEQIRDKPDISEHVGRKPWVDEDLWDEAFAVAEQLAPDDGE